MSPSDPHPERRSRVTLSVNVLRNVVRPWWSLVLFLAGNIQSRQMSVCVWLLCLARQVVSGNSITPSRLAALGGNPIPPNESLVSRHIGEPVRSFHSLSVTRLLLFSLGNSQAHWKLQNRSLFLGECLGNGSVSLIPYDSLCSPFRAKHLR